MPSATVLYDQDCGFCRWSLAKLLAWDRRRALTPVPLASPEAGRILDGMPEEERIASWHLLDSDGRLHSAGAAFPPLLRLLPVGAPLAAIASRAPRLTDRGYRWVADHRSGLGRFVTDGARRRADRRIEGRLRGQMRP
ncbi:MAG TPA: DCC1-like thiol-disulfide oxidoreductase family protein [Solirubrobacterales bacterium]|nr:DCC1-like thiol-disulfide oxidoreductase family protein [Solirubrobacterales bacterium]